VVFGDTPLPKIPDVGWCFRKRITWVDPHRVGEFGIGVTLTTPAGLATSPDRASRVPNSWMAGFWGRTYSNFNERPSDWKPQELKRDDELCFLVTLEGECVVYVNERECCRFGDPHVPVTMQDEPELTVLIAPGGATTWESLPSTPQVLLRYLKFLPEASDKAVMGPPPLPPHPTEAPPVPDSPSAPPRVPSTCQPLTAVNPSPPPPSPTCTVEPHQRLQSSPVHQGGSNSFSAASSTNHMHASCAARKVPQLPLHRLR
jgi:hypothetical protein